MTSAVVVILAMATLIRSAFGFGEALIAVPLLALLIPVEVVAPTAALISITAAILSLYLCRPARRGSHSGRPGALSRTFGLVNSDL